MQQKPPRGLVIDVRGNTGGRLDEVIALADLFLNRGIILRTWQRGREQEFSADADLALPAGVPVSILVNGETASAAEMFAASMQANGRATLVGTSTYGKGSATVTRILPEGSGLVLTIARCEVVRGQPLEGNGVRPDIECGEALERPSTAEREEVLEWLVKTEAVRQQQLERAIGVVRHEHGTSRPSDR
jgi:carboxyl-terminal processing protease